MYEKKEDIPGYREDFARAFRHQQEARDHAFLVVPRTLCGEPVVSLTLIAAHRLEFAENPYICGGEPTIGHALSLIWQVHADHRDGIDRKTLRMRERMATRIRRRFLARQISDEVATYVDRTFLDSGYLNWSGTRPPLPVGTMVDSMVCEIASAFGWDDEAIMRKPLERLFLYRKRIRMSENPEYMQKQPTDLVNERYIAKLNALRKEAELK